MDIFGYPAEVPALVEIAERHGLARVEDACQSIDGAYDGRKLGTFGHPAVYGFYANKQLTTAEGGVVLPTTPSSRGVLVSLRNQGRSDDGAWLVHSRLGFNYRLSDVHCAIGVAQLERLDDMMAGRARVAGWYQERRARDRRRHAHVRGRPSGARGSSTRPGSTPTSRATRSSATSTPRASRPSPTCPASTSSPTTRRRTATGRASSRSRRRSAPPRSRCRSSRR